MPQTRRFGIRPSTTRGTRKLWAKSALNAALFFAIFLVALPWGAHWLVSVALPLPPALSLWGGGLLFVAGIGLWLLGLDVFSRRGEGTPFPLDAPRQLTVTGPFARVRNPIMLGELAAVWGEALWFASLGIAIYALVLSLVAHLAVVFVEEPELRARFGERYREYAERVPRWVPRLRAPRGDPRAG
jgi:protein-S-isoprenylcysteine O-methyltransferase Ste14